MAVSISDLQVLIEASVKPASAGQKSAAAGRLDERHFRRMDKLDGKNWKEFSFQFKTAVGSVNTTMRGYLNEIRKGGKDADYDTIFVSVNGDWRSLGGPPKRSEWPGLRGLEQTLQPVRSWDSSEVADGHDGCHDTEKGQRT